MKNRPSILLIEDDAYLTLIIQKYLEKNGFKVNIDYSGKTGLKKALTNKYDLLLIDIGLPEMNGLNIIKNLREVGNNIPIIIITNEISTKKEIDSFNAGTNLYHRKPIKFDLLISQIKSLMPKIDRKVIIKMKDIEINTQERTLKRSGHLIYFTKTELDLLLMLIESNGCVFSRDKIIANILNYNKDIEIGAVDTMVSRIRKKLKKYGEKEVINTIFKEGYRLDLNYARNCKIIPL